MGRPYPTALAAPASAPLTDLELAAYCRAIDVYNEWGGVWAGLSLGRVAQDAAIAAVESYLRAKGPDARARIMGYVRDNCTGAAAILARLAPPPFPPIPPPRPALPPPLRLPEPVPVPSGEIPSTPGTPTILPYNRPAPPPPPPGPQAPPLGYACWSCGGRVVWDPGGPGCYPTGYDEATCRALSPSSPFGYPGPTAQTSSTAFPMSG